MAVVLKTTRALTRPRGFESHTLRSIRLAPTSELARGLLLRGRLDRRGESTGLMCACRVREARHLAIGHEATIARLPVWQIRAGLLPVNERRLVAPVAQACHCAPVRFSPHKGLHRSALLPGGERPPRVVRVGEHVRAEVAVGLLRLLQAGDGGGEEPIQERRIPQPKPGHNDDWHHDLPNVQGRTWPITLA